MTDGQFSIERYKTCMYRPDCLMPDGEANRVGYVRRSEMN